MVLSPLIWVITIVTLLITPLITIPMNLQVGISAGGKGQELAKQFDGAVEPYCRYTCIFASHLVWSLRSRTDPKP